jgi:hypothetical protein
MYPTRKSEGAPNYKKLRTERRSIKNLRLYSTLLEISPAVSNIRSKLKLSTQDRPSYQLTDALSLVHPAPKYSRGKIRSTEAPRCKIERSIGLDLLDYNAAELSRLLSDKVENIPNQPIPLGALCEWVLDVDDSNPFIGHVSWSSEPFSVTLDMDSV